MTPSVKNRSLWFVLSLGLNLVLAAALVQHAGRESPLPSLDGYFDLKPELVPVQSHPDLKRAGLPYIEFHGHVGLGLKYDKPAATRQMMKRAGARFLVNLTPFGGADFQKIAREFQGKEFIHFTGIEFGLLSAGYGVEKLVEVLKADVAAGARGVKIWKNFGLRLKDGNGELLAIDSPKLKPLWDYIARENLPVAMHAADPPAFFRPINKQNERIIELGRHPDWSFYGENFPDRDDLLAARDRLFARRRDIRFVALHFGAHAQDLKRAGALLDKHPNVWVDIAQRIDELGRQPYAARDFFLKYQDRILFGSDGVPWPAKMSSYFRFLETRDEYFPYDGRINKRKGPWRIYGLGLPKPVLKKIYYNNAAALLGLPKI